MSLPLVEAYRLAKMSWQDFNGREQQRKYLTEPPEGRSEKVLAISGLLSTDSCLTLVKSAAEARLPRGSEVVLHEFSAGVNLSLFDMRRWGIPVVGPVSYLDRHDERKRIDDNVKRLADDQGEPITVFGYSLGGILGIEASLRNPAEVKSVVTAGAPLGMPEIGIRERSDSGKLHVIFALNDRIVPKRYATNGLHDTATEVPGGHWGLVTRSRGINAIVDRLSQPAAQELQIA
jgi:pimeloyl-ACP methyl ester carboxylesterase